MHNIHFHIYLHSLLQEKDKPNTEYHFDNLVSVVWNMFSAGTETTSSTVRQALLLMMKHPDIQGEINNIFSFKHQVQSCLFLLWLVLCRACSEGTWWGCRTGPLALSRGQTKSAVYRCCNPRDSTQYGSRPHRSPTQDDVWHWIQWLCHS